MANELVRASDVNVDELKRIGALMAQCGYFDKSGSAETHHVPGGCRRPSNPVAALRCSRHSADVGRRASVCPTAIALLHRDRRRPA